MVDVEDVYVRRGQEVHQSNRHSMAHNNWRATLLRTPMVEEFIYYAPPAECCAMGWRRKRPEGQPHLAPKQGEDDTRPRRKRNGCGGQ